MQVWYFTVGNFIHFVMPMKSNLNYKLELNNVEFDTWHSEKDIWYWCNALLRVSVLLVELVARNIKAHMKRDFVKSIVTTEHRNCNINDFLIAFHIITKYPEKNPKIAIIKYLLWFDLMWIFMYLETHYFLFGH